MNNNSVPFFLQERIQHDRDDSFLPEGWLTIVQHLHRNLIVVEPDYNLIQVKEKFGELRFYTSIPFDEHGIGIILINHYIDVSAHTCDVCGDAAGTKRNIGHLIATRCNEHKNYVRATRR